MRARGGESWRGRGGKGGGDDAMFGNRYLRAHAQGTTRVVGSAGGVGERREGGAPAPGTQRPQRLQLWSPLGCGLKAHCSLSPSRAVVPSI